MLKRSTAWLLVLALILSVMPVGVLAEGAQVIPAAQSHSAEQHDCEHCDETITWTAWDQTTSLPKASGHYYLTADVKVSGQTKLTGSTDVTLCLNGYTISGENFNGTILYVQDTAKLTISDCTAYTDDEGVFHAGTIKNCKAGGAMSAAIYAKHNCAVALYNCIFTANKQNYVQASSGEGYGGMVQLRGDKAGTASSLYMENVVFDGNTGNVSAGALNVYGSTTTPVVTVKNCTFKNNTALNGGAAYLRKAKATFTDCVFEGNTSKGGSLVFQSTTKALTGGTVVLNASEVTMEKCTFKGNTAIEGGAVYSVSSTLTMTDCTMTENTADFGGTVYSDGGKATLNRCTVSKNHVKKNSAGNLQSKNATMLLDNCTVENNTSAGTAGSAMYIHGGSSKVTLKDTSVINNRHTGTGVDSRAGIYVTNKNDKLTVTGKTVIDGNLVAADGNAVERNIYMQNSPNAIDVSGLTNGASISVWTKWDAATPDFVTAATAPAKWSSAWVLYEKTGKAVDYNETDRFHYVENQIHEHCVCGITGCAQTDHKKVVFQPWTGDTELPTSGAYYLTEDVKLDGQASVSEDLTLCLNGHTVTQTKAGDRVIDVTKGNVLITGCKGGTITGGKPSSNGGGGIRATGADTKLALYNVTVNGNESASHGGGIHVVTNAQATLTNVTVSGNTAVNNGGGIAVRDGGKLTMDSCIVSGNESARDGAGLYGQAGTEVTVTDTEVASNSVTNGAGGGVAISGKGTLTNVTIKNNTTSGSGAGLIVQGSGEVTVNGGQISGNIANGTGGGIYALKQLTLNGTTVTGNAAKKLAGGVYLATDKVLTITGETVIKDNAVTNLYLKSGCNLILDNLTGKAHICVSVLDNAPRAITGQTTQNPSAYIYSDSLDLQVAYRENVVYLDETVKHKHCLCGGEGTGCDHGEMTFAKWDKTDSLPTAGAYYLENDVVLTGETNVSGDLTLCLNGHTVTAANNKRILSNPKNTVATIVISDCTASVEADGTYKAGKLTGGKDVSGNTGGGAIYVRAGGTLKLYDGIISDCSSTLQGGAICLADTTKMEMHGGEISNCRAVTADGNTWKKGGAIAAYKAELTITGGTIKNNEATNGAISGNNGSIVTITGGTICDNWSKSDGGGVYVNGSGLYISGSAKIYNNESTASGGNICYGGSSYGSVTGITVEGGKASAGAGAMVQNGAVVEFSGVTFKDNVAESVAGAIRLYKATLTVKDCAFTGNTAKEAAGISAETSSELTLTSSVISGNTATGTTGGIQIDSTSNLVLAGKIVIKENAQGNLLLRGGTLMDVTAVTEGAEIWLSADMGPISKPCDDLSKYFKSESNYRSVVYRDGALHMATDGSHKHCFCSEADAGCSHEIVEWVAWESTTTLPTSGNYYLLNDVQMTDAISVSADLNLCLNGHTVTAAEGKRHIATIKDKDADVVICDCTAATVGGVYTAGKLTGGLDKSGNTGGGAIYLRAGSSLELFDGIITGNISTLAGGAIALNSGSAFTMHGGEISGNKCLAEDGQTWKPGGAIFSASGNDVKILGGTIKNNEGSDGGGIRFSGQGNLLIAGGTISGNISHGQGGGVFASSTTVTISGGKITGNEAASSAGGLCLGTNAKATMTGGEISGNKSKVGAGVILQGGAALELSDGKITGNTSSSQGGGVGMFSKAKLIMTGGEISKNTSEKNGAGVYCTKAFVDMQGGKISDNTSGKDGAGIYVNATGNVDISGEALITGNTIETGSGGGISYGSTSTGKISGGTIEKNKAAGGGGLMIQNGAKVEITGGKIQNNTALSAIGGGIRVYKAELAITGGTFRNNKSVKSGGGAVAASTKSTLTISGGTFEGNKAQKGSGGAISTYSESVFTMTGGTVKNNFAKTTGGGIASNKCTTNISGVTVTGNSCERDGAGIYNTAGLMNIKGGVVSAYNTTKGNGGGVCYGSKSSGYISGISVYGNSVDGGGGGMIIQNGANVTISYASVTGNTAKKTAGGIYLYKAGMTITDSKIAENAAVNGGGGGGIYAVDATAFEMSNMVISKNTSKSGGGVYALRSKVKMTDSEISENVTNGSGSGFYTSGGTWKAALAGGEFTNVKFIGNRGGTACSGAAVYMNADVEASFTNCEITKNISENYCGGVYAAAGAVPTMVDCTITGNEATKNGGGLLVRDCGELTNCYFADNKADKGAAVFGGNYMEQWSVNGWGSKGDDIGLFMTDCTFENNTAVTDGGAFHLDMSCYTTMDNCTFTGNKAGSFGSAMWLWENCTMTNLTVTGNKCDNNGHALYLADSEHDGQTYINGLFKMGGNMIVKDNEGGDVYLANKVTIGALKEGYGDKTHMGITLDAGLLTQRVMGEYNYEGGNLKYTLTYGNRSMTDPEYLEPQIEETEPNTDGTQSTAGTEAAETADGQDNSLLYAGIGGIAAVVVLAAVVLVIVKKRKSAKADVKE